MKGVYAMKSLCAAGLVLASLGWLANAADAQSGPYQPPTLLPLPPVSRVSTDLTAASYNTYTTEPTPAEAPPDQFNSAFTTRTHAYNEPPAQQPKPQAQPDAKPQPEPAPTTEYEQALHDTCWDDADACGADHHCGCGCGWFGAIGGLVMTRNRGPNYTTTYQNGSGDPLMNTQDASAGWTGGAEVTLGYAFGGSTNMGPYGASGICGRPGIAFTWWGTGELNGFASVSDETGDPTTALNASFDLLGATINGNPASDYFQGAQEQRIWRTDNVNSFEANLLAGSILNTGRLELIGMIGFRYFRFSEVFTFGSVMFDSDFEDDPEDAAYLSFRAINNLYGAQVGGVFNYNFTPRVSAFLVPKAGIYGNQMTMNTQLYDGDGVSGGDFTQSKGDVAFLGQIDTGLTWAFHPNLRAYLGYRVVGLANVALGEPQFLPMVGDIKQSGSLILHGANMGVAWMY
jgi:hypothetical protein